jgi:RNA polymerase sigma-70 factor, ECF subfamily
MCYFGGNRVVPALLTERDTIIARFERLIAPHLDAAFNLAVWLTGSKSHAEDVVLGASLRACQELDEAHGKQGLVWFLAIVHSACYRHPADNGAGGLQVSHKRPLARFPGGVSTCRPVPAQRDAERLTLVEAVAALPMWEREALILHEIEHLSCQEIAAVANMPVDATRSSLLSAQRRLLALQCA